MPNFVLFCKHDRLYKLTANSNFEMFSFMLSAFIFAVQLMVLRSDFLAVRFLTVIQRGIKLDNGYTLWKRW